MKIAHLTRLIEPPPPVCKILLIYHLGRLFRPSLYLAVESTDSNIVIYDKITANKRYAKLLVDYGFGPLKPEMKNNV